MESIDSLKLQDRVTVTVFGPDSSRLYRSTGTGYHSLDAAISATLAAAGLDVSPADCVFEVDNLTTGVSHRYRLNAHGHLKLIV